MKKKADTLPWKYCECGCHGHELNIGNQYYWLFNDLQGGFHLHTDHGWLGPKLGTYSSFKKADRAVREHIKPAMRKLRKTLNDAREMLKN